MEENFDAVICGSDQIWNVALPAFESIYMLDFPLPGRKISYAAGMMDVPFFSAADRYPQLSQWLEDFDAVSVRENAAKTLIQTLTGGKVSPEVVLDPTLLLQADEWLAQIDLPEVQREPYLFCYMFHMNEAQRTLIQRMAEERGCIKIIFLDQLRSELPEFLGIAAEIAQCVSIEMFLALIRGAEVVITDSFHGTVFSILFERVFFSLESESDAPERNTDRIATLLEKVGLSRHLLWFGQESNPYLNEFINYSVIKELVDAERWKSLFWLKQAIWR